MLSFDNQRGVLYGMTPSTGDYGGGTIFSYSPSTNTYTQLYSFGVNVSDGIYPTGDLVLNPFDNLYYGLTDNGGSYGNGTVFSFNPDNDQVSFLYSFGGNATDGSALLNSFIVTGMTTAVNTVNTDDIELYPNPGNGLFTLKGLNGGEQLDVYNELGQHLLNLLSAGKNEILDLRSLEDGVYVLQITGSNQSTQTLRIVKTR